MMELVLHYGYTFEEAIAAFGAGEVQQVLCDSAFVMLPRAVLCFATISDHEATSQFVRPSTFEWRPARPDYAPKSQTLASLCGSSDMEC